MNKQATSAAPQLNPLQRAWLQEIGLDRRLVAYYAAEPEPASESEPVPAAVQPSPEAGVAPTRAEPMQRPAGLRQVSGLLAQAGASRSAPEPASVSGVPAPIPSAADVIVPQDWEGLQALVAQCRSCELHAGRSHAVFGTGAVTQPDWMVIGEAPGSDDDRTGLPFQGKMGLLLQAMLASIQVTSDTPVFYTNLVKCRPLGNRPPAAEEIAACMPYLQRQIALLAPRRILALGGLAAQAVLGVSDDLETLRGTVHQVRSETGQAIPVVVTYHPAALLLRPQHKPDAWHDLNLARDLEAAAS